VRPRQIQYSRDQRNASEELHLVKFNDEVPEEAGRSRRAGRAGGDERLCLYYRMPQIERQSARRASK
jgi:hypothetical protein